MRAATIAFPPCLAQAGSSGCSASTGATLLKGWPRVFGRLIGGSLGSSSSTSRKLRALLRRCANRPTLLLWAGGAMKKLNARAWLALAILAVVMGLLLFVAAGTVRYWQAWVYLLIFTGASVLTTLYLMRKDPALLERRLSGGPAAEKQRAQKFIMLCISIGFIALLVVPALDHRFGWSSVPLGGVVAGDALVAIGFYLNFLVYRENTFASATIQVIENQKVISTGPYAIVRHPMYASDSLYLLGTPLALGSYWGFVPLAVMMPFLIWRLFHEERFLTSNLPGYAEYQKRVKHRLVPFVW
jgi:protein-S-isoprenylcysteine O-methyltransferase Ste14